MLARIADRNYRELGLKSESQLHWLQSELSKIIAFRYNRVPLLATRGDLGLPGTSTDWVTLRGPEVVHYLFGKSHPDTSVPLVTDYGSRPAVLGP
jgi:hypothetical protein